MFVSSHICVKFATKLDRDNKTGLLTLQTKLGKFHLDENDYLWHYCYLKHTCDVILLLKVCIIFR